MLVAWPAGSVEDGWVNPRAGSGMFRYIRMWQFQSRLMALLEVDDGEATEEGP